MTTSSAETSAAAHIASATQRSPEETAHILERLDGFEAARSRLWRVIARLLPWITLLVPVIPLVRSLNVGRFDFMLATGFLAAALSLLAFQRLMRLIPGTLSSLWTRGVIGAPLPGDDRPPAERYAAFIQDFEDWLNHSPGQWVVAAVFAVLAAIRDVYSSGGIGGYLRAIRVEPEFFIFTLSITFIGFVIGLMAWRMVIVGVKIYQLGRAFNLEPQLGHPDNSAGFAPLGNLALWDALIVSIPATFLGGWIIVAPSFVRYGYEFWVPLFNLLIIVPIVFAFVGFLWPLLSVHRVMVTKRDQIRRQLDELGQSINALARETLIQADHLDPSEGRASAERLEMMREIYRQNQDIPVWPFNTSILVRFSASQVLPLLGLTGLGGPIFNVIESVASILTRR